MQSSLAASSNRRGGLPEIPADAQFLLRVGLITYRAELSIGTSTKNLTIAAQFETFGDPQARYQSPKNARNVARVG
jgi:hypothetical protein